MFLKILIPGLWFILVLTLCQAFCKVLTRDTWIYICLYQTSLILYQENFSFPHVYTIKKVLLIYIFK